MLLTLMEIKNKLKRIFHFYKGEDNAITPHELFENIFNINPENIDIYKREYWWNVVKLCLRQLRSTNELFIINKRTKLFVLKTESELINFKNMINQDIKALNNTSKKAEKWVKEINDVKIRIAVSKKLNEIRSLG